MKATRWLFKLANRLVGYAMGARAITAFACGRSATPSSCWPHASSTDRSVCTTTLAVLLLAVATSLSANEAELTQRWQRAIANDQPDKLIGIIEGLPTDSDALQRLIGVAASNGKNALMVAVKLGSKTLAERLVATGADMEAKTLTGGTPFMFSVLGNQLELARWLQASGVDINARGTNGWSAATIAAAKGHTDMLRWLLTTGVDYNSPDVYGFTPLMRAVDNLHVPSTRLLLQASNIDINAQDETGNTALHHAVAGRHELLIALLVEAGASTHLQNREGQSARALAMGQSAMVRLLK